MSVFKSISTALFGKPFNVETLTPTEELVRETNDYTNFIDTGDSDKILEKLNQFFAISLDAVGRYTDIRLMEISAPEVGKALTYMASFYTGFTFINTEDKLLETQIEALLDMWKDYLEINHQNLYGLIRDLLKYGDVFVEPAYITIPKENYDKLIARAKEVLYHNAEGVGIKLNEKQIKTFLEMLIAPQETGYKILGGFKYYEPDFFEIAMYINDDSGVPSTLSVNKLGDLFKQLQDVSNINSNDYKSLLKQITDNQEFDFLKEGKLYILKRKVPLKPEPSRQLAHFSSVMTPMPQLYFNPAAKRFGNLRLIIGQKDFENIKKEYFVYRYNEDMYHLALFVDLYRPYGTSLLDGARLAWKKMELLEEIMVLRRMMSLKRGWWKLTFPTRLSRQKISFIMKEIVNRIKRVKVPDLDKQSMHSFPLLWGLTDEVVIPVSSNEYDLTHEEFSPYGGDQNKEIEEYTQIRDRFYNGLYIPKNLLKAIRDGETLSADIVSQDKMFKEIGKHVRKVVSSFLERMIQKFYEDRGLTISQFNIVFLQPEEIEEILDMLNKIGDNVDTYKILKSMGLESILKYENRT